MISIDEAKTLARELAKGSNLTHSAALEAVAHAAGCRDWNTFHALANTAPDPVDRQGVIPVLRSVDAGLARAFYCGLLGFRWVWERRAPDDGSLHAEVARDGWVLQLSEGEIVSGGAEVMFLVDDLDGFRSEIYENRRAPKPMIDEQEWGRAMTLHDLGANRLVFWERARG